MSFYFDPSAFDGGSDKEDNDDNFVDDGGDDDDDDRYRGQGRSHKDDERNDRTKRKEDSRAGMSSRFSEILASGDAFGRNLGKYDDGNDDEDDDDDDDDDEGEEVWLDDDDENVWEDGALGLDNGDGKDYEDDSGVDWEDADNDDQDDNDNDGKIPYINIGKRRRKMPTSDVTIDLAENDNGGAKDENKQRKRRRLNKIANLPSELSDLVRNVRRTHLLSLAARASALSRTCSDETVMGASLSLILASSSSSSSSSLPSSSYVSSTSASCNSRRTWPRRGYHALSSRTQSKEKDHLDSTIRNGCVSDLVLSERHCGGNYTRGDGGGNDGENNANGDDDGKDNDGSSSFRPSATVCSPLPSMDDVRRLASWFSSLVNNVEARRRNLCETRRAEGAPLTRGRGRGRGRRKRGGIVGNVPMGIKKKSSVGGGGEREKVEKNDALFLHLSSIEKEGQGTSDPDRLLGILEYVSPINDDVPDFDEEEVLRRISGPVTPHEKTQLFVAMARSLGWRARYVTALRPISGELTVDHPLFFVTKLGDVFHAILGGNKKLSGGSGGRGMGIKICKKKIRKDRSIGYAANGGGGGRGGGKDAGDVIDLVRGNGNDDDDDIDENDTNGSGRGGRAGVWSGGEGGHNKCSFGSAAEEGNVLAWAEVLCAPSSSSATAVAAAATATASARCDATDDGEGAKAPPTEAGTASSLASLTSARARPSHAHHRNCRWVHVDVERDWLDQPRRVEGLLADIERCDSDSGGGGGGVGMGAVAVTTAAATSSSSSSDGKVGEKRKKRMMGGTSSAPSRGSGGRRVPVSYVLAVEHAIVSPVGRIAGKDDEGGRIIDDDDNGNDNNNNNNNDAGDDDGADFVARYADVTPRYASAWSETMRLRGCGPRQIARGKRATGAGLLRCADEWWFDTIRSMNRRERKKARNRHGAKGNRGGAVGKVTNERAIGNCVCTYERKPPKKGKSTASNDDRKGTEREAHGDKDDAIFIGSSSDGDASSAFGDEEDQEQAEQAELLASADSEAIPTSKAAFKNHPLYVIPSVLKSAEVLAPDSKKRICGMFKGELVYHRSDVSTALPAKRWLYEGRKVRDTEIRKPVKLVKARKRSAPTTFRALTTYGVSDGKEQDPAAAEAAAAKAVKLEEDWDGKERLYGKWQTDAWAPKAVGPNDEIPVNEYKNVELELLNPGLVHLDLHRIAMVAKKLSIPYAPCLLGFEGHGGNRTPTIRGIVVHSHNADLLRMAHIEFESHSVEKEYEERQKDIYRRWKKFIVGLLTKERLEREYGDGKA